MNSSEIIKAIRESLNYDQTQMAAAIGIHQGSYSTIESGKTGISTKVKKALTEKLNVRLEYILTGEGEIFNSIKTNNDPVLDPLDHPKVLKQRIEANEKYIAALNEQITYFKTLFNTQISQGYVFVSKKELSKPK